MIRENLRMGLLSIRRNPLRSVLCTIGVAIGIASVVAVASVADGLTQSIGFQFGDVGAGHISVMWTPPRDDIVRRRLYLSIEDGEAAFREAPTTATFDPVMTLRPVVRRGDEEIEVGMSGVGLLHLDMEGKTLTAGRFFNVEDMQRRTRAAVLGSGVMDLLGSAVRDPIGEQLLIDGVLFTVVGVLAEANREWFGGDPNQTVLIPVTTALDRFAEGRATRITLNYHVRSLQDVELAEEQIREGLRRARGLPDAAEDDFEILAFDSLVGSVRGALVSVVLGGIALAAISLLAGGVGVMNVMLVVVRERSREIGIRKAMGAGNSHLVAQFLIESVLLSLAGGALGAVVGAAARVLAPAFTPQIPLGPPPLYAFAIAFAFSVAVGVVFGLYPAVVAARRDAWESIRSR